VDHVLSTERLVLRPVTTDDHPALLAHWTQPAVRRFLFDSTALSAAEVAETIEESLGDFAAHGYGIWLIELGSGSGLVGTAGLRPLEESGLEIFYSLAPGAWGHGYATEAALPSSTSASTSGRPRGPRPYSTTARAASVAYPWPHAPGARL